MKPAPVRYSHGTREGRLTVAPFRAWRGSTILVAWGPTFNAPAWGSFNTTRPRVGSSTPLERIAGYRAPLPPRLARPRRKCTPSESPNTADSPTAAAPEP